MATFNDFCKNVKKGFVKLGTSIEGAADTASLHLKLTSIENKIKELYEELGRLTYEKLRIDVETTQCDRVDEVLDIIDGKMAEKKAILNELDRRRAEKEAKKEAAAPAEEPKPEEPAKETKKPEEPQPEAPAEESAAEEAKGE